MSRRFFVAIAAIVALAAVLTIHRLGEADVCGVNEAVEGVFVQQMVEHGALLFPVENGRSPMYKPPLFHWTATAIDRIGGIRKVTPFNLRLPAALYAIAGAILTMAFAYSFIGEWGAALAGMILCGSYQYIQQGRIGRVDMTLCFFETLALFLFMWWFAPATERDSTAMISPRNDSLRYLFALALGLGVLAKGPVGAILPAAACGIFLIAERRFKDLWEIAAPGPVLLAIVVGGSWYAACLFGRRYGFLDRQIGSENFGRFFGALGSMAPWYYVKPLLLNSAPLSLFVPVAVYFALRTYGRLSPQKSGAEADASISGATFSGDDARAIAAVRLCAIFWLVTVVFFNLAAYKRRAYLLPLWPPAAIMLAWWVEAIGRRLDSRNVARAMTAIMCAGLAAFNFFYLPYHEVRECGHDSYRRAAEHIDRIVGRAEPLYSYGIGEEPAPLIFYLDRNAPPIRGKLGDAPPGYVIIPAREWARHKDEALDLEPIYESTSGAEKLILLRHGKAYALR
ncbi:MAG TPA: phospholipid carrier-dependent glycosyltransferase [Candidatus Binataceae bacterium]|nr:phospholipid carrier-dependent glycosyltransferase [Candidatus Binataceae bacterium]